MSRGIGDHINVLNHGFVRLVDYMGSDLSVVRAARVSYDADWRTGDDAGKDEKLIHYLLRNKHTSPFESVVFTFEIKCPIFVLRQWGRHRTQEYNDGAGIGYEKFWSYNETSARYAELPEEFWIPEIEDLTTQAKDTKQARSGEVVKNAAALVGMMKAQNQASFEVYHALLQAGVAREIARTVLPFATYTRLFGTVNLHNLMLWLRLRLHMHAQKEIRVYAEAVHDLVAPLVPVSIAAFVNEIGYNFQDRVSA